MFCQKWPKFGQNWMFCQKSIPWSKIEFNVKNLNFGIKSKFWSKIETFLKNRNFYSKIETFLKNWFFWEKWKFFCQRTEIFVKNRNFGQNKTYTSWSEYWPEIAKMASNSNARMWRRLFYTKPNLNFF